VRSDLSSTRIVPLLVLAIPCLAPLLSGCDESYPTELSYPLRTDPIVVKVPGSTPWEPTGPGQLDNSIAKFEPQYIVEPAKLDANTRQQLDTALGKIFGTPAEPTVDPDDEDAKRQAAELKLDKDTLKLGSKHYRRHCMHCHGVPGDGRGPTGPWISPHPRDYRQGVFKFISTDTTVNGRKPRREDLHRTLERGIEGTSMPSFGLLEEKDLEQIISYVIHLSMRGEVEMTTMKTLLNKEALDGTIAENAQSLVGIFLKQWSDSNGKVLEPTPYPYKAGDEGQLQASIRRGYELFTDPRGTASCIACHLDFGRQVPFRYDDWGTLVRPSNLTAGVYRGGRRPIDLYWRIRTGILGAQMPKAEFEQGKDRSVDSYWDLVNFVQALPYPGMLPEDIRDRIYHSAHEKAPSAHAQR
jgi:mono/diheme cytochrome c family protein